MLPEATREGKLNRIGWGVPALALLVVVSSLLLAEGSGRVEKTFDTGPNPWISVTNLTGQVAVRGWDKAQVYAQCAPHSPRVEVDAEGLPQKGLADKIYFTTHVLDPLLSSDQRAVDYVLEVPVGSNIQIRNSQGSVQIEKLQSEAMVESVGGSVSVTDFSGHLTVRSVGGNIDVIRPSGLVEAVSITGNLHFVSPTTTELRGSTTSGHILYEGDFIGGDYVLSDYSGDVDVVCPPSASFELSAKTVRGKLDNALHLTSRRHASPSPLASSNSLLGTSNAGKATVELRSFSGTIRIRPR